MTLDQLLPCLGPISGFCSGALLGLLQGTATISLQSPVDFFGQFLPSRNMPVQAPAPEGPCPNAGKGTALPRIVPGHLPWFRRRILSLLPLLAGIKTGHEYELEGDAAAVSGSPFTVVSGSFYSLFLTSPWGRLGSGSCRRLFRWISDSRRGFMTRGNGRDVGLSRLVLPHVTGESDTLQEPGVEHALQ